MATTTTATIIQANQCRLPDAARIGAFSNEAGEVERDDGFVDMRSGGMRLGNERYMIFEVSRKCCPRGAARRDLDQPYSAAVAGSGCSATIPDTRQRISGPT